MGSSPRGSGSSGEIEGWLKKKSPKTQGKKMMDVWQRRRASTPPCLRPACSVAGYARRAHRLTGWERWNAPRRYFVLSGGELKYYKTEKAAHMSNAESLKAIALEHVLAATANPRHVDMFIIDLGLERKVKLQAGSEQERDAWVAAIEAAKLKAWSSQEQSAFNQVVQESKRTPTNGSSSSAPGGRPAVEPQTPAAPATPFAPASREGSGRASHVQIHAELLRTPGRKQGCCIIS